MRRYVALLVYENYKSSGNAQTITETLDNVCMAGETLHQRDTWEGGRTEIIVTGRGRISQALVATRDFNDGKRENSALVQPKNHFSIARGNFKAFLLHVQNIFLFLLAVVVSRLLSFRQSI